MINYLVVTAANLKTLVMTLPARLDLAITWRSKIASAIKLTQAIFHGDSHSVRSFGGVQTTTCFLNSRWGHMLTQLGIVAPESRFHSIALSKHQFH